MNYTGVKLFDGKRVKAPEEADPAARFFAKRSHLWRSSNAFPMSCIGFETNPPVGKRSLILEPPWIPLERHHLQA
jgi:hypothetical protein